MANVPVTDRDLIEPGSITDHVPITERNTFSENFY